MEGLKVGQTVEIVEWLGDGNYRKESIGFQSIIQEDRRIKGEGHIFIFDAIGDYICAFVGEYKLIGRLKVKSIK